MSRFPGIALCAGASVMLTLCALDLSSRESLAAGLCVAAVALGLMLAALTSIRTGMR